MTIHQQHDQSLSNQGIHFKCLEDDPHHNHLFMHKIDVYPYSNLFNLNGRSHIGLVQV